MCNLQQDVGDNSVLCTVCSEWGLRRYRGVMGNLNNVIAITYEVVGSWVENINFGTESLHCIDKFC